MSVTDCHASRPPGGSWLVVSACHATDALCHDDDVPDSVFLFEKYYVTHLQDVVKLVHYGPQSYE